MNYLLPCSCGQKVKVSPSQAGESVVCRCGKTLQIPTLLKMKSLDVAAEEAVVKKKKPKQKGRLRVAFFWAGVVILVPSLLLFASTFPYKPYPTDVLFKDIYKSYGGNKRLLVQNSTPITRDDHLILTTTDFVIANMMPFDLYQFFLKLEEPTFSYNFQDNYQAVKDTRNVFLVGECIGISLAVLLIVLSFFMPKQNVEVTGWTGSEWK